MVKADENQLGYGDPKTPSNSENGSNDPGSDDDEPVVEVTEDDMEELNNQLDELHSALDVMEQRNESIQSKLLALLKSNREEREKSLAGSSSSDASMDCN